MVIGWKGIATTLNVSVDTAQRWRLRGLPVFNLSPRMVAAEPAALRGWVRLQAASCGVTLVAE